MTDLAYRADLPQYRAWYDAVKAMGGRVTRFPYHEIQGTVDLYGATCAAFDLTQGSALVAQGLLPAVADGVSADHRTWYYLAPEEVIKESLYLGAATAAEGQAAGALLLADWTANARQAISSAAGVITGIVPAWLWLVIGGVLLYQAGILKRRA
jgi:hypothetical protein